MNSSIPLTTFQTLAELVRTFPARGSQDALLLFNGFRVIRYSYEEIYDLSRRCAAYFEQLGIPKGGRVLIWSPSRPEWGVVFCACALSGVVLVPLDARNTGEFVRHVAQATEAQLIFHTQYKKNPGLAIPALPVESLFNVLGHVSPWEREVPVAPEDPFEIVYTSGTTGNPKGVVLTHRNIVSNLGDILEFIPIDSDYHLLSLLPLSHALEQTAGFWTPMAGGGSVLYLQVLKPSALFEVFQRESITAMVLVPRLLELLKQHIEQTIHEKGLSGYLRLGMRLAPHVPASLRKLYFYPVHKRFNTRFHLFVSGGAALPPEVERFWNALGFVLLQGYGLTETSPVLTATRPGKTRIGSVGFPLRSVSLRLGPDREILVQGPNVFSGYYNNPQATREVFEEGWFKTGDVGELDDDGYLYIRSRKKDIIVTSDGINVYPEDIEQALARHPAVKETCVLGLGAHEDKVHAVLLLKPGASDPRKIIQEVNAQLPPEQQIESWNLWPRDDFPKTTTLKIKKNEVRKQIRTDAPAPAAEKAIEGTTLEKILSDLSNLPVQDLKSESKLGQDLGLSSIDRVDLIARLEEEFRLDIDDNQVTAETTVSELDRLVNSRNSHPAVLHFRRWTRSRPCQAVRWLFQHVILRPALRYACQIRCLGRENAEGLEGPFLIVANHTSHLDVALVQTLLPPALARKTCPAAWKEYFDLEGQPLHKKFGKWLAWQIATIGFNIFPFPQYSGFRQSMAYAGELCDAGWSILFFPEGERSQDGRWAPFREGTGILVKSLQVPLLPIAIQGGEKILPRGAAWPKRGTVQVAIGRPFTVSEGSPAEITRRVEEEIRALWRRLEETREGEPPGEPR
ncbi:MAG: AMP-binding protein [bacterium]